MKKNTGSKIFLLIAGILLVVLGVVALFNPQDAIIGVATFIAIGLIVVGVIQIAIFFTDKRGVYSSVSLFTEGLVNILIGLLLLFNPNLTTVVLAIFVQLWTLFKGISRTAQGFTLRRLRHPKWLSQIIWGVVGILLSLLLIIVPGTSLALIATYISMTLIFDGVALVYFGITI